jgi:hypothetical protein
MTLIQPVLIVLLVCGALFYRARMRSRLWDRTIVFILAGAGVILVVSPDLSIALAHSLGVGRGVDLIIYLGLLGFAFLLLSVFSKIRVLEAQITLLTRELSLWQARNDNRP